MGEGPLTVSSSAPTPAGGAAPQGPGPRAPFTEVVRRRTTSTSTSSAPAPAAQRSPAPEASATSGRAAGRRPGPWDGGGTLPSQGEWEPFPTTAGRMAELSGQQAQRLLAALRRAGTPTAGLRSVNPYSLDTPKAREVQMALEVADPVLAAELAAPFRTMSLELAAAMASPDFNPATLAGPAAQEWAQANPEAAAAAQQQREAEILASWDAAAREMAAGRGVDLDAPRRPQSRFEAQQLEVQRLIQLEQQARRQAAGAQG